MADMRRPRHICWTRAHLGEMISYSPRSRPVRRRWMSDCAGDGGSPTRSKSAGDTLILRAIQA